MKTQDIAVIAADSAQFDRTDFRRTCGSFVSGVTTILSVDETGDVHGMTANGFISVSLDPPIILVSVGEHTKTHEYLMQRPRYSVSVLGHQQTDVANHFAGRPLDDAPLFSELGGHPVVAGSIARFVCRIVDRYQVGDHTLFMGLVENLEESDGLPLVFSSGRLFSPLEEIPSV